jgi:hypothetical protein
MLNGKAGPSGALGIGQLQDTAINVVDAFCSIVCRPVEMILRPFYGTRYFTVPVIALSTGMVIAMPIVSSLATGIVSMIPLAHVRAPIGMFGVGSLAQAYFLLSLIHAFRIYRRMIHMELEQHSEYEGDPLPIFYLLPKGRSFWFTRIVLEPVFVGVTATLLGHMYIFQSGLVLYLQLAALALMMKQFISWYRSWEFLRILIDARYLGPIIARLAENRASDNDLAQIHMASFPKNVPDEIRRSAASHIAHVLSPNDFEPGNGGR